MMDWAVQSKLLVFFATMKIKRRSGSKKLTLRQKHKIHKKSHEQQKKIRKFAKKNPHMRRKLKKDPGIPNLWPFKAQMLMKIQKKKEEEKLRVEKERAERKERREERKEKGVNLSEMAKYQFAIKQKQLEFEAKQSLLGADMADEFKDKREDVVSQNSKRKYYSEFKSVLERSDVIIIVLDARDPLGCKNDQIEKMIESKYMNTKIIYLLNKIDLVPREVLKKWLAYLRKFRPAVAFKCNTQRQRKNFRFMDKSVAENAKNLKQDGCLGADSLVKLLKNYSRSQDIKRMITVGIIGYPNVGKSSVINSLKRAKVVNVGSTPGMTKNSQEIKLDKNISLLDCPGVVFSSSKNIDASIILRNAVRIEQLEDPIEPVACIVNRCKMESLMSIYKIQKFEDEDEFLAQVAKIRGKLKKGGKPNLKEAAKTVLRDWNLGKIPFFTLPPTINDEDDMMGETDEYDDSDINSKYVPSLKDALMKDFVPMVSVSESLDFDEDLIDEDEI